MQQRDNLQVLVIDVRSKVEARTIARSLSSERRRFWARRWRGPAGVESVMASVATWEQFGRALRKRPASIVHIVSRTSGANVVELEDADGVVRSVFPTPLAWRWEDLAAVEIVVMDGCYVRYSATTWLKHVNAVIGIPASVPVADSARFACELYRALAGKSTLSDAFEACRNDHDITLHIRDDSSDTVAHRASTGLVDALIACQSDQDIKRYIGEDGAGTPTLREMVLELRKSQSDHEAPRAVALRELLLMLRKGYTLYKPILIEVEPGSRISPDDTMGRTLTMGNTLTMGKPLDWAKQDSREYAGHAFRILGENSLAAGLETPVIIGRSRRCDVCIDNESMSKVHASVVFDRASGEYQVVDENSRNGTCINGEALTPGVPAAVWSGAYVRFGDALFVFLDPPTLRKMAKLNE
jgi:hypothetical protein